MLSHQDKIQRPGPGRPAARWLWALGLVLIIGPPTSLFAQERLPIHIQELLDHRDVVVDYRRVDSLAATLPLPLPRVLAPTKEIVGYLRYWDYGVDFLNALDYNLLTQINYFGAELNPDGSILTDRDWGNINLVNFAHARGVKVKLTAILFGSSALSTLLGSSTNRQRAIDNLLAAVQAVAADGIDIDFEVMPDGQKANMVTFMRDLAEAFHSNIPNSIVTMAMPAVDWSNRWDYNSLAQLTDGLFIMGYDYHWNGSNNAGPVSPLDGFSRTVRWTVNDYLTKTGNNSVKIILGLPYYARDWPVVSTTKYAATSGTGKAQVYSTAAGMAQTYGRNWDSNSSSPWFNYQDNGTRQVWYDDSLSLSLKYELALEKDLAGVGMWALGLDGSRTELWGALADHFTSGQPPGKPIIWAVTGNGDGTLTVSVAGLKADSYRLQAGTAPDDLTVFGEYDEPQFTVANLPADTVIYLRVQGINTGGEGPLSEVLGSATRSRNSQVLIVNGFDRISGTNNTFDFIKRYGPHVARLDLVYDAASNEAVVAGLVDLGDYQAVIWIVGEDATSDDSFNLTEQQLVSEYLTGGGYLLASGSEIGYDLVEKGTSADKAFYRNYLKAEFIDDQARDSFGDISYRIDPLPGTLLAGLTPFYFDDGTHGAYHVDYPDGIKPAGGADLMARYRDVDYQVMGGAGIVYRGTFGGTTTGGIVYLAVGFETIYPAATRDSVMARILDFFQVLPDTSIPGTVLAYRLYQNYPNPFMEETYIPYDVLAGGKIRLTVYNLRGALVRRLVSGYQPAEHYTYTFLPFDRRGRRLASGLYIITLQVGGGELQSRKMILRK